MVKAGHPQKQAVAAAFRESGEKTRDAMPASVKILGGSDPTGSQELVAVPRMMPATPAGTVQNVGLPSAAALPEPYPFAAPPVVSKSVYPQPRVPIAVVGGEEVAVKDAEYGGGSPEGEVPENAGMSGEVGEIGTGDAGGLSIVNGKKTGYEISTDAAVPDPVLNRIQHRGASQEAGMDSFAEVEHKAAKEYGSEEAGKRVAAAVGFKALGKKEMERRAEAGKK
jgi:hypothetical protein